jgi:hypothetical protein
MGAKMCIDVHLTGKNTLAGFRSLFTFSGALFMCMNNYEEFISKKSQLSEIFENIDLFTHNILKLPIINTE